MLVLSSELEAHQIQHFFSQAFPYASHGGSNHVKGRVYGRSARVSLIPFES